MPPQNGQLELLSETRFWHCGFRHKAINPMLMNLMHKVSFKLALTVNQQKGLRIPGQIGLIKYEIWEFRAEMTAQNSLRA